MKRISGSFIAPTTAFVVGLVALSVWRLSSLQDADGTSLGAGPTLAFIGWTIVFVVVLSRTGISFNRLGFGAPFAPVYHLTLAISGVIAIKLAATLIDPMLSEFFGQDRDLSRFETQELELAELLLLLVFSWTFAAIGEEIAFRVVLLQSLLASFGNGRVAIAAAVILQAAVFGAVHLYQGPVGMVGATMSGLVFGTLVVMAHGNIWPAIVAHGLNNTLSILSISLF